MSDRDLEADLRRVLADPAHRLPDTLVPLDRVHEGACRRKERRHSIAAVAAAGAVVVAVAFSYGVTRLTAPTRVPVSGARITGVTPLTKQPSADRGSATAAYDGSPQPVPADFSPVSVTAASTSRWWVLGSGGKIASTSDGGQTFTQVGAPGATGLPGDAVELRFAKDRTNGWAVVPSAPASTASLWRTADGGQTWRSVQTVGAVAAIELGGGEAYALQHGSSSSDWTLWQAAADGSTGWSVVSKLGVMSSQPLLAVQGGRAIVAATDAGKVRTWVIAGGTSTPIASPCDPSLGATSLSSSGQGVWISCAEGMGDGLWRMTGGLNWVRVHDPGLVSRRTVGAIDDSRAVVGLQNGQMYVLDAGGPSMMASLPVWVTAPSDFQWTYLAFTNATAGFALGFGPDSQPSTLLRTTDGGLHWAKVDFS